MMKSAQRTVAVLRVTLLAGLLGASWSCSHKQAAAPATPAPDLAFASSMDRSVDPAQDFYRYATGGWLNAAKLPPDSPTLSRAFSQAAARNAQFSQDLIGGKINSQDPAGLTLVQTYYKSCMDQAALEERGLTPVRALLDRIAAVDGLEKFFDMTGILQMLNVPVLFSASVSPDSHDPTVNLLQLTQGGLGLPGRNFYQDKSLSALKQGYTIYLRDILTESGMIVPEAEAAAQAVVAFEGRLADASVTFAELNDPSATYNPAMFADFQRKTPQLPWKSLFAAQSLAVPARVNIQVPGFFSGLNTILPSTGLGTLRSYLRARLLLGTAQQLPARFSNLFFDFYGKQLQGQTTAPLRASLCQGTVTSDLGDLVQQQYVELFLPPAALAAARELIEDLQAALRETLEAVTWMDAPTKNSALEKASAIIAQIGAPTKAAGALSYRFDPKKWFENAASVAQATFKRTFDQAGKAVDPHAWYTDALTVNAYYDPQRNVIVVPAGILQLPFFSADAPGSLNYGSIGAIVGHELTHGFDSGGRLFDAKGRMRDWWSAASAQLFAERSKCFVAQYGAFQPFPGVSLNGSQTLNENIADNGGLKLAYAAYQRWRARHRVSDVAVAGMTDKQALFVAFGQTWATVSTPAFDRNWVARDPHALPQYRVNGSIANSIDFAALFKPAAGTPMNPPTECSIW